MELKDIAPWNWLRRKHHFPTRIGHGFTESEFYKDISRIYEDFFRDFPDLANFIPKLLRGEGGTSFKIMPRIDISENDKEYIIEADLPGVKEKDLDISTSNDYILTLKGKREDKVEEKKRDYHLIERSYGSFERRILLPEDCNLDQMEAHFDNGILTLKVQKQKPKAGSTRKIKITRSQQA